MWKQSGNVTVVNESKVNLAEIWRRYFVALTFRFVSTLGQNVETKRKRNGRDGFTFIM